MALEAVNPGLSRPVHLSFDIDGLDPTAAPSTGTTAAGGLTLREGRYIAEALAQTGKLRSMDMVEINPRMRPEHAQQTVAAAATVIRAALGRTLI
jgi:arginase